MKAGLDQAQAGIKIARRNINNLRYAHDTTLMAESEEELKSLLMKVKEDCEKADLKHNISKTKIMSSSSIPSWQIDGGKMETDIFCFFGLKKFLQIVTAAIVTCSWEEKFRVFKSSDSTLPTKIHIAKATVFPVVMYRCESWTIKKAQC